MAETIDLTQSGNNTFAPGEHLSVEINLTTLSGTDYRLYGVKVRYSGNIAFNDSTLR